MAFGKTMLLWSGEVKWWGCRLRAIVFITRTHSPVIQTQEGTEVGAPEGVCEYFAFVRKGCIGACFIYSKSLRSLVARDDKSVCADKAMMAIIKSQTQK